MQISGRFSAGRFRAGQFAAGRFTGVGTSAPGPVAFDPVSLFGAGEKGAVYDFGAASPGTVLDQVADLSPNGNDLAQSNSTKRPVIAGVPTEVGPVLVANPRFATDSDWSKGAGWSIGGGVATKVPGTASGLTQSMPLTPGTQYIVHISATRTAGNLNTQLTGGATVKGYVFNESRSHTDMLVAVSGNTTLSIWADSNFSGTVSNVTIQEVTDLTFKGAYFDGADNWLRADSFDLSGSQTMTLAIAMWRGDKHGNLVPVDVGGYTGTATPGSVRIQTRGRMYIRNSAGTSYRKGEVTPSAAQDSRFAVEVYEVDLAGATLEDQIKVQQRGVDTSGDTSGSVRNSPDLPNDVVSIGAAANGSLDWLGIIHKVMVINRHLSPSEKADLTGWMSGPALNGALIGDSTIAYNSASAGQPAEAWTAAAFLPWVEFGQANIATPGDKIAQQKTAWQGLVDKSALGLVIVQVGLNDCNTYALSKSAAQIIADLQDLIDTVRADVPAACKIYVAALTPARGWLGNSTDVAAAYAHWQAVNTAIEGVGGTPITGVDGRITGKQNSRYWDVLGDGSDNLRPEYDHNADGVHPSNEGRFLIAQTWRAQLVADGVLS